MATDYPEARALTLAAILPAGVDRWVALFDGDPINGGVEVTVAGYVRVAHQDWTTVANVGASTRTNLGAVTFPQFTEAGKATHFAIYDASVAGILLRSSHILDNVGDEVDVVWGAPEDLLFTSGSIALTHSES